MDNNKDKPSFFSDSDDYNLKSEPEAPLSYSVRRRTAQQIRRDRMQAYAVMIIFGLIVIAAVIYFVASGNENGEQAADSQSSAASQVESAADDPASSAETPSSAEADDSSGDTSPINEAQGHEVEVIDGRTYIDGILIVNKTYSLPQSYAPGLDSVAEDAFYDMAADAYGDGIVLYICSGYRSYEEQEQLYNNYATERGVEKADEVSSRPGHSEHQSGLCMDVNTTEFSFEGTPEAIWLEENCADYGFIIRFPEGKEEITGYTYEPWHIRYVGVEAAKEITSQGICLEEYLDVSSDYANAQQ